MTDAQEQLSKLAAENWQRVLGSADAEQSAALQSQFDDPAKRQQLDRLLSCSTFFVDNATRSPDLLLDLLASGDLWQSIDEQGFRQRLDAAMERRPGELDSVLRAFRRWHMLRILWRDFCRLADTLETVTDTSLLAETCIARALTELTDQFEQRYGVPRNSAGEPQGLLVIAMGKLGARELNLSSDIDLIFTYPENGQTEGVAKTISNEQFFIRLGQALIAALDKITAEGFVFRVDMRLRPYGESGALVHNFAALEAYYQDQGRDWERYAMIKARVVAGDSERASELMDMLRPFVYRRYIDFGVIDSLRSMKQMIGREVQRRGMDSDVKLGRGGIREIEFIAQCFQLIRGGRERELQRRELLPVLDACAALGSLPAQAVAELKQAYLFLRDCEHGIQGYADRQTQALPSKPLEQMALAEVMGFGSWDAFRIALDDHRSRVQGHFDNLIAETEEAVAEPAAEAELWGELAEESDFAALGYQSPAEVIEQLRGLWQSPKVLGLQAQGRERLDEFMPLMIKALGATEHPDTGLTRLLPLVQSVVRRSAYLALLIENPAALSELVALCSASPWIAELMSRHPVLLDELLDRASLYSVSEPAMLREELARQVARLPTDDLEAQMDAMRYFKAAQVLRVAASELFGQLHLKRVSDYLTWIAEAILEQVVAVAWADLCDRYGEPARDGDGTGFAVLGYGKLGGIELGYGSDLDLVFVYDAHPQGVTNGKKSIDNSVFYTRLGQRIIHILDTRMAMGQLYETDMRLRPSGDSGLLAVSLKAFRHYQAETAWTWEHQALVRCRFIAGDSQLGEQVENVRRDILCRQRDGEELREQVSRMRQKMRDNLLSASDRAAGLFDIKQSPGGIVDIEFIAQYAVLAWSQQYPELARWSDNVRIFETLAEQQLMAADTCEALTVAYLGYRSRAHQLALQQEPAKLPATEVDDWCATVVEVWQALLGDSE